MPQKRIRTVPQYQDNLVDFACDLRHAIFSSQQAAADALGCNRTTISRYEKEIYTPPPTYLAGLAVHFAREAESNPDVQQALLQELNLAIERCYEHAPLLASWAELEESAKQYNATAKTEQPSQSSAETSAPERSHAPIIAWGGSPDVANFCGRQDERQTLQQWIVGDRCKSITITGMGGIGKTMLAKKVSHQIHDQFDAVIWRTLRNEPPPMLVISELIQRLNGGDVVPLYDAVEDQDFTAYYAELGQLIFRLLELLQQRRCLLILDNVESILEPGSVNADYRPAMEGYGRLFQQLAESGHISSLLLTSREQPRELTYTAAAESPVRNLALDGMAVADVREMLMDRQLAGTQTQWQHLIHGLSGNPLALKMSTATIGSIFNGQIGHFLETNGTPTVALVEELLTEQLKRITPLQRQLLFWLAIEREPALIDRLAANLVSPVPQQQLVNALQSLCWHSLVQVSDEGFVLQEVILASLTARLVDQVTTELCTLPQPKQLQNYAVHTYALLKSQAKDYVRQTQKQLIVLLIVERLQARFLSTDAVAEQLQQWVQKMRTADTSCGSYGAGNIANLLIHLGVPLAGYDFSHLPVWQAYLDNADLRGANFSRADLRTSSFIQVFDRTHAVAVSPNGDLLAGGTTCGEVQLWQIDGQQQRLTLTGHTDWVRSIAFHPHENRLISGCDDGSIRIWDLKTGQSLHTFQSHSGRVLVVAASPDGNLMASGGDDKLIRLWDLKTGRLLRTQTGHERWVWGLVFSPDGAQLVSSSGDATIRIWDVQTGNSLRTLPGHTSWVWDIDFTPDGQHIVSCSHDASVRIWDAATGNCRHHLPCETGWIRDLAISPDGALVACGTRYSAIQLWSIETGEWRGTLSGHRGDVWAVDFADNRRLISGGEDHTVRIWDVETLQAISTLAGYKNSVYGIHASPDGTRLAAGGEDGMVHLWDRAHDAEVRTLVGHTNHIQKVAFSADGKLIGSCSGDRTVRIWDAVSGNCLHVLTGHQGWAFAVAFSPDGELIATGSIDSTVRLWQTNSGDLLGSFEPGSHVDCVSFSPNGKWLAAGCEDGYLTIWDVEAGLIKQSISEVTSTIWSALFCHDNQTILAGYGDGDIRIHSLDENQATQLLGKHEGGVEGIALSLDGTLLASAGHDAVVRLWDLASQQQVTIFEGHKGTVFSVAFLDEQTLASGSEDGTVKIWRIADGYCIQTFQAERPYEGMDITGVTGIGAAQKESLLALGAVES